ncbi:helix-turn-helix transcriptional regulator [Acetoanaerobium noterae]|uniref:helix-turn-helix transcriptional regulator n=1 Tax=Acetoanaerobium noterae TaxID=745369 RepID=UPI003341F90A
MRNLMKVERVKKELSQQILAEKVGISREYISMIENGERTPSVLIAKKISRILEIEWTYFFENKSNEMTHKTKGA